MLDALGVDRAAIVGLSIGGGLALDVTLAHPDRVWALVHVAAGVSGMPGRSVQRRADGRVRGGGSERSDLDTMMEIDFAVWAPLGADDEFRELWRATPDALGVPDGAKPLRGEPANDRLEQVAVPTLVIVPAHDPPAQREVGATVARRVPGAQLVEIDSDHYLTLREPDRVTRRDRDVPHCFVTFHVVRSMTRYSTPLRARIISLLPFTRERVVDERTARRRSRRSRRNARRRSPCRARARTGSPSGFQYIVYAHRPSAVVARATGKPCMTQPFCVLSAIFPGSSVCAPRSYARTT